MLNIMVDKPSDVTGILMDSLEPIYKGGSRLV